MKILLVNDDDVYNWVLMSGLASLSEAFSFVHGMYHEATACHVLTDICACLSLICRCLKVANDRIDDGNDRQGMVPSINVVGCRASLYCVPRLICILKICKSCCFLAYFTTASCFRVLIYLYCKYYGFLRISQYDDF